MEAFRATQWIQRKGQPLLLFFQGALREGLTGVHGLSRPNGPKEMPHHENFKAQATLSCCTQNIGVMKNKNTPLGFSH